MAWDFKKIKATGGGMPVSPADCKALKLKAVDLSTRLRELNAGVRKKIDVEKNRIDVRLTDMIASIKASGSRGNPKSTIDDLKRASVKELGDLRREILKETEARRLELIRELSKIAEDTRAMRSMITSPRTYLAIATPAGSPRKQALLAEFSTMNQHNLAMAAQVAVQSNDLEAGAIIVALAENFKDASGKPAKPFSTANLAEALVGDLCREAEANITECEVAFNVAHKDLQELEGRPISSVRAISDAITAHGADTRNHEPGEKKVADHFGQRAETAAISRISEALKARGINNAE